MAHVNKPKSAQRSETKNSSAKWPGGHKSNAESKHIYCSFISIHYKLNLPRATDAKPQFASKISSLEVSNSPRPHQPWHTTVETLPPFQTEPRRGPHRQLLSINCFRTTGPLWSKSIERLFFRSANRLDFSLLGSGVRKWSVQPWAFLMYVENLEMDNSLKCVLFIKVSGQITSNTLWK